MDRYTGYALPLYPTDSVFGGLDKASIDCSDKICFFALDSGEVPRKLQNGESLSRAPAGLEVRSEREQHHRVFGTAGANLNVVCDRGRIVP